VGRFAACFFARPGLQMGQGPAPRYLWPRLQVFQPPRFGFGIELYERSDGCLTPEPQRSLASGYLDLDERERCQKQAASKSVGGSRTKGHHQNGRSMVTRRDEAHRVLATPLT
jgi:hypothetical protein